MKPWIRGLMHRAGFDIVNLRRPILPPDYNTGLPPDFDQADIAAYFSVRPFTMTSPERIFSLRRVVEYLVKAKLPGAYVECGVWRGGSMMAIAQALLECRMRDHELYLFDTFEGWPEPTAEDGTLVHQTWHEDRAAWSPVPIEVVQANLAATGYPSERLHYVAGRVEDTLPEKAPDTISLLRLDTDFYQSTKHELATLYPRLVSGGVLIIDDYGYYEGSRRAVDEFFHVHGPVLLNRIDSDARIAIKP